MNLILSLQQEVDGGIERSFDELQRDVADRTTNATTYLAKLEKCLPYRKMFGFEYFEMRDVIRI